jgi:hypothetical protein
MFLHIMTHRLLFRLENVVSLTPIRRSFLFIQWKLGDEEPSSWADHYRLTPCVPTDFLSVHKALEMASSQSFSLYRKSRKSEKQIRSIRILLRPGTHFLKEAITIDSTALTPISIQAIELPKNIYRPSLSQYQMRPEMALIGKSLSSESSHQSSSRSSLRGMLRCRRAESVSSRLMRDDSLESTEYSEHLEDWSHVQRLLPLAAVQRRATIVLRSKRHNEPAFRIRQGHLVLENVDLFHHAQGLDIWNGNAAIQIQPPADTQCSAVLRQVHVTSQTGRGIVTIDGGYLSMLQSAVTDCAATGIYIGGNGSRADLDLSDVLRNGLGYCSSIRHGGIARGHSGVYLEQGVAQIVDCNISRNTLTGISAVSPDNAVLLLEKCDLMSNGTNQLEIPQEGSLARQQSITRHNQLSVVGRGRLRSGLTVDPCPRRTFGV